MKITSVDANPVGNGHTFLSITDFLIYHWFALTAPEERLVNNAT